MSAERDAKGVVVVGKRERDGDHDWDSSEGVSVTVEIPRSYNLELRTAGGDIDVRGVEGAANGRTNGGRIRLESLRATSTCKQTVAASP